MGLATLSVMLFMLRGLWMIAASSLLLHAWARRVPHVIDTLLLASAISLAWWSRQSPLSNSWLTAKVLALIACIMLGALALRYGKTRRVRILALIAALVCFAYIVGTAVSKNPLFFMSALAL